MEIDAAVAGTSKGKKPECHTSVALDCNTEDVPMKGNLSKYSLEEFLDNYAKTIPAKAAELLALLKGNIAEFYGNPRKDGRSSCSWAALIMSWRRGPLAPVDESLVVGAVLERLAGDAKESIGDEIYDSLEALLTTV
ncbi:hypothetical protein COEREDRAFT_12776 [Coemansia reversa NRRL 1564]|uniref:Uncharacterized protein n=1 Tax=Coemansia reversa (strain ATCC 12441 / NRRL 1564) TaxID=763665 RepID=A0A2G5B0C3_COERN|nr:hypothetical protein COEREDRAFT_12776 [Coemansia reversa NRRL 1564]|eukprot:PIA12475.1 hypothetical protein COEREDRAFT_12776 [Coemansia reversa NRRL 1564]